MAGLLAHGTFSTVWRALRSGDGAPVALKVSRTRHPLARERFRCEAAALDQLGPPWSPRLYQHGVLEDGRPYLAMEGVLGTTLAEHLEALPAPPDLHAARGIALGVLGTLEAMHERELIHLDLAPENIVIETTGDIRLLSFGLAQRSRGVGRHPTDPTLAAMGATLGTPEYAAPERLRGEPLDVRADVYGFGVLLFELLTLRTPFAGDRESVERGHTCRQPPRPSEFADVPASVEALVLACLAKERSQRPSNAAAVRAALAPASAAAARAALAPASAAAAPVAVHEPLRADDGLASAEARQEMVVLAVEARGAETEFLAAVARHDGILARQRGYRFVAVFPGIIEPATERALRAGREIVAAIGAPAAIHLAPLKLRHEPDGSASVHGVAIERPEAWLPAESWRGIAVSAEIVQNEPRLEVSAASEDGRYFFTITPAAEGEFSAEGAEGRPDVSNGNLAGDPAAPLREGAGADSISAVHVLPRFLTATTGRQQLAGRIDVLQAIDASRERALAGGRPRMCLLLGERGLGRSRLAAEAAERVRRSRPDALVISLRAEPPLAGGAGPTARALLARVLDVPVGAGPSDPLAICREQLGAAIGEQVWTSVAALLGWGGKWPARRGSVLCAIAEGLRRRALARPVAVIVDDAHLADGFTLDALDLAARPEGRLPLWIFVTATPGHAAGGRALGRLGAQEASGMRDPDGSRERDIVVLPPLRSSDALDLCAELLKPAEHPPASALQRICAWAGNNPRCLVELVRALKRAGFVRQRAKSSGYYLAGAELEKLTPSPAWHWYAAGRVEALPAELASCVELCAVLGFEVSESELHGVLLAARAASAATVDARAALRALVEHGVLVGRGEEREDDPPASGPRYAFRTALLQEAIYGLLDEPRRAEAHRLALGLWEARAATRAVTPGVLQAIARHAAACGARGRAANAYLMLGDLERDRHQNAAADRHYAAALLWADGDDQRRRYLALVGRARVRYRALRTSEALEDLRAAGALARTMADDHLIAQALLEEATALDGGGHWEEAAERVEEAVPLFDRGSEGMPVAGSGSSAGERYLDPRLEVALGRSCFRRGNLTEAIERLTRGAEDVRGVDHDAHAAALLLLASAFVRSGRLDLAERRFADAVAWCEAHGDRVHLIAAMSQRVELWAARNEPSHGIADLARAVDLAREEGIGWAEREATLKLAELLYIWGREDEALPLARRARAIDEQFMDRPVYGSALLLARLHAMRNEPMDASRQLRWLRAHWPAAELSPFARALLSVLQLAVRDPRSGSDGARMRAAFRAEPEPTGELSNALSIDERLELLYWRARALIDAERPEDLAGILARANQLLGESRIWRPRFAALGTRGSRLAG